MHMNEAKKGDALIILKVGAVSPERRNALHDMGLYELGVVYIDDSADDGVMFHKDSLTLFITQKEAALIEVSRVDTVLRFAVNKAAPDGLQELIEGGFVEQVKTELTEGGPVHRIYVKPSNVSIDKVIVVVRADQSLSDAVALIKRIVEFDGEAKSTQSAV